MGNFEDNKNRGYNPPVHRSDQCRSPLEQAIDFNDDDDNE